MTVAPKIALQTLCSTGGNDRQVHRSFWVFKGMCDSLFRSIDNPQGVIGLEVHGEDGLLRSLAVSRSVRDSGCGTALVKKLEDHARSIGINHLYLLTETAEKYFENKGYLAITRDMVSEFIAHTKEFSELCPASASVMRKDMSS